MWVSGYRVLHDVPWDLHRTDTFMFYIIYVCKTHLWDRSLVVGGLAVTQVDNTAVGSIPTYPYIKYV